MRFTRALQTIGRRSTASKHTRETSPRRRLRFEPLESRNLLIAGFSASLHATMTMVDTPSAALIDVLDEVAETTNHSNSTTGFPSFVNATGSSSYDLATRTLTIDAASNGAAIFTGGDIEQAIASGIARLGATIPIVNWSDRFSWQITVRVSATFRFSGLPDHASEFAETVFALGVAGNRLDGLPAEGVVVPEQRADTRQAGRENGFDLVTNTFLLNVQDEFHVWIPPSLRVEGGNIEARTFDLGLFGQAGGAAASRYDGNSPLLLGELPPGPGVLPPPETPERTLTLTVPPDITLEAPADFDPTNTGHATAIDSVDANPIVTYVDIVGPGAASYLRTITRTWTATNHTGVSISDVQVITEADTTPPVLRVPSDVNLEAPANTDPAQTGFAEASDSADPSPVLSFADAVTTGVPSYLRVTRRTWTAIDEVGNAASVVQVITEVDTTSPVLVVPGDFVIDPAGPNGAALQFVVTATDSADPSPIVSSSPASGSIFPIGTTTVMCSASDAAGNRTTASFTVTVLGPLDLTNRLIVSVDSQGLRPGVETSLLAKLRSVASNIEDGRANNDGAAVWQLRAFIYEVQAQRGKAIPLSVATEWTEAALLLIELLKSSLVQSAAAGFVGPPAWPTSSGSLQSKPRG